MTARATAAKANCARRSPSPPAVPGIPGRSFISTPLGCSAGSGGGGASTGCTAGLLANISPEFGRGVGGWARASLGFVLVLVGAFGGGGVRATAASSQTRAASACVRSRPRPSRERERVFFFFFFSFFILFYCSPFGRAKSGAVVSGEPRRHCGVGPARLHRPGSAF